MSDRGTRKDATFWDVWFNYDENNSKCLDADSPMLIDLKMMLKLRFFKSFSFLKCAIHYL